MKFNILIIMENDKMVNHVTKTNDDRRRLKDNYIVFQTKNYSRFIKLTGNRDVNKLHVKRLRDSFEKRYLISPIIVNENWGVIDGQHRLQAAEELGLPVNYIVVHGYGLEEVQILNTNMKNWKKEDYLNAYCDLGYPEYLKFRNFMRRFQEFGIAACENLLTNRLTTSGFRNRKNKEFISATNKEGSILIRYFQEGNLKIHDYDLAVENAEKIILVKPYYDGFNRVPFVAAMMGVFRIKEYDHDQLIKKLKANPTSLQHCSNVGQYKLLIEEIYNFRSREKISLRF